MKKLLLSVAATVLTVLGLGGVAALSPVYAAPTGPTAGQNVLCPDGTTWATDLSACSTASEFAKTDLMTTVNTIINVIIGLVGFIAVVVLIIGGINFITSQGDTGKVTKARNTILYGVVGLVVALLAFAIVNFVLGSIFS